MKTIKLSLVVTGVVICLALVGLIMLVPASSQAKEGNYTGLVAEKDWPDSGKLAFSLDNERVAAVSPANLPRFQATPTLPSRSTPTPTPTPAQAKGSTGTLVGQVWDLFTDAPAPNVTVSVSGIEVVTGSDGRYALHDLAVGQYEVIAQLPPGGATAYSSATVTIVKDKAVSLDLSLYSQPPPTPTPVPTPVPVPATSQAVARTTTAFVPGTNSPLTVYAGKGAVVWVNPEFVNHEMGRGGSINIDAADMSDFGGFQGELIFDPTVIQIESVELGNFLESTDRIAGPLMSEIDNGTGRVFFGVYSSGRTPGPNGGGTLVMINFTAIQEGQSTFDLQNVILSSRLGNDIEADILDGIVSASACFGDFNRDKVIDINDIQSVAGRVGQVKGDPNYDEIHDLNFDGQIDQVDVEIITARWNQTCSQ